MIFAAPPPIEITAEVVLFMNSGRSSVRTRDGYRMSAPCEQWLANVQAAARAHKVGLATTRVQNDDSCTLQFMTAAEYSKRHSITTQAVTERCRRGTLPAQLINGQWRIFQEDT